MTSSFTPSPQQQLWLARWKRFSAAAVRAFHVYAGWLVSISWKRFALLALALVIAANILQNLPPFTWKITQQVEEPDRSAARRQARLESDAKKAAARAAEQASKVAKDIHYEIKVDERGLRIQPVRPSASAASAAEGEGEGGEPAAASADGPTIAIDFPKSARPEDIQAAIEKARDHLDELKQQAREVEKAQEAAVEARQALREAAEEMADLPTRQRVTVVRLGDSLVDLAVLWILASAVIKAMYKGRIQAEVKAAQAAETAESEALKRQVVEARMAAMQAQVEPHFLFNTLASIDHLIETDPPRASQMQRNLIALLRASMPTMREANATGTRDLGRELAVIRPYLEILKVRMEERLQTEIDVPEGLQSAEFPPMMIQGLVENAIKHGLEPKAEGGQLKVKAEIQHGKLAVTVADTGLGFGRAATSGTGVGLANIRERLQLLYGAKAAVTVTENQPSGTIVTITVPYRSRAEEGAST
ncbi:MAG: sensor histidine kinase [Roseateles depolymerans]|uniref:histidine kinase n=1 Tax=Roseateles depolymerans TaxID=76731 RepID=A0A2W5FHV4_9BURK|nr:MAG: sensor histidine kinase [Roseateles depolymerans]